MGVRLDPVRERRLRPLGVLIVNGFSVVAVFAAVLRAALGMAVLVAGARAIRSSRSARDAGTGEDRFYLLVTLCATLVGLSVVSWPLLYLVLESYVPGSGGPQWPGVMCIQGVTRIGTGSVGAASLLPPLVGTLLVTKPLLVLVSGAWLVLHLVNRKSRTGALTGRVLPGELVGLGQSKRQGGGQVDDVAVERFFPHAEPAPWAGKTCTPSGNVSSCSCNER